VVKKYLTMLVILLFVLTGCTVEKKVSTEVFTAEKYLLGTDITVSIETGEEANLICNEVFSRVKDIEDKMSAHSGDSEIALLNAGAGKEKTVLSAQTYHVLSQATEFAAITGGAFDPTIGSLVQLWGINSGNGKVPVEQDIQKSIALVNYKSLQLAQDGTNCTAYLPHQGQIVDLGGIAKGYAGDEAKQILLANGIKSGMINLGGNIVAIGKKKDGSHWRVGIQNPLAPRGTFLGIVQLDDKSVVSSGAYERYFIKDGKRYHHIIDPNTGHPSESDLIGVTIIADQGIAADALSTGVFVLGLEKGIKLVDSLQGVDAILIAADKKVFTTRGIEDFKLTDGDFSL